METFLDVALGYGRRGWPMVPFHTIRPTGGCSCGRVTCDRPAKHPRLRDWVTQATTAAEVIRRWWTWWPTANAATATGGGRLFLDVDGNLGAQSVSDLERTYGPLPDTPRNLTGGGGVQHLFTVETTVPNKVALAPGVDIRGDGGAAVLPPSLHASGRRYAWDLAAHPDDVPLAPAPRWLLELIATSVHRPATTPGAELHLVDGERNDRLFRLACGWRRRGVGRAALLEMLTAVNRHHTHPPLPARELAEIADSVAQRYAPGGDEDAVTDELLARALGLRP